MPEPAQNFDEHNGRKYLQLTIFHKWITPPCRSRSFDQKIQKKNQTKKTKDQKILLVGDFNAQTTDHYLSSFLYQYELSSIVKESTSFQNVSNSSCIDIFLTNSALSFQHTLTVSSGLSDFVNWLSQS